MARSMFQTEYKNFENTRDQIATFLTQKGYKLKNEKNETVWKCGVGFWTAMKYVKIEFAANNTLIVSGWIRPALCGEQDLNGFVGAIPKKQVMSVIQQIQVIAQNA